jgi:predicted nuclease of predicted toxin-antitoxin system
MLPIVNKKRSHWPHEAFSDSDYNDLSLMLGFPPKVIWIRRGNCSTMAIAQILRASTLDIQQFHQNSDLGVLTLH